MANKNSKNQNIIDTLDSLKRLQEELESMRIPNGDINYFTATAMLTQEIKHSAFIAWLIDPIKEHNLGSVMLERFIERLFQYNNIKNNKANSIKSNFDILCRKNIKKNDLLDACKNGKIEVETEVVSSVGKRADLCISLTSNTDTKGKYLILIENKVFSTTHDDQLNEYEILAEEKYSDYKTLFVYLTPTGELPYNVGGNGKYNNNWCIFDYEEVREIIKGLHEDISDKSNFPRLDSKNRTKLKLIMEDYIAMVNNSILIENPDVWNKIRQIRNNYERELQLINEWQDSSEDALRYCHDRVKEIFAGRIHFIMGETLDNACAFRFYTDEITAVFDAADGNFDEVAKTPHCYIECTGTYCSIQLIMQKHGEWTPRQIKAIETISTVKALPNGSNKLLFQEYFLKKGDRAKKFDKTLEEYVESKLQAFAKKLEEELKKIVSWRF